MRKLLILALATALSGPAIATTAVLQETASDSFNGGVFQALSGDPDAARSEFEASKRAVEADPDNADALAERGMLGAMVGSITMQTDPAAGQAIFMAALEDLDRAVAMSPDNPKIRVIRGIVMQQATYSVPDAMAGPMLAKGLSDFEFSYEAQVSFLDGLGEHRLGELLQLKADLESRSGLTEQAARTYAMIQTKLPGSEYASRADVWMETRTPLPQNMTTCVGCHVNP